MRGRTMGTLLAVGVAVTVTGGCAQELGPRDGRELPPTEIERVGVGEVAPDFSLEALAGDTLTLSDFRGKQDVVLVFYRGWW